MIIGIFAWGFLCGFMGCWELHDRLSKFWVSWLLGPTGFKYKPFYLGIVYVLSVTFTICSVILVLGLVPLLVTRTHDAIPVDNTAWRELYGVSFLSSWGGYIALGIIRRIGKGNSRLKKPRRRQKKE